MPIAIVDKGGRGCPMFICDWCGEQIERVEEGNVYWLHDAPTALYFNHKRCAFAHDRALEELAEKREALLLSEHIEVFLAQLLGNSGRGEAMSHVDTERLYEWRG
jgi:hypothetical protein